MVCPLHLDNTTLNLFFTLSLKILFTYGSYFIVIFSFSLLCVVKLSFQNGFTVSLDINCILLLLYGREMSTSYHLAFLLNSQENGFECLS